MHGTFTSPCVHKQLPRLPFSPQFIPLLMDRGKNGHRNIMSTTSSARRAGELQYTKIRPVLQPFPVFQKTLDSWIIFQNEPHIPCFCGILQALEKRCGAILTRLLCCAFSRRPFRQGLCGRRTEGSRSSTPEVLSENHRPTGGRTACEQAPGAEVPPSAAYRIYS